MTWVLDEDALLEAKEKALNESRRRCRAAIDEILDELGISDPVRREGFHSKALTLAMPIARKVIGEDVEEIRRRTCPATHH